MIVNISIAEAKYIIYKYVKNNYKLLAYEEEKESDLITFVDIENGQIADEESLYFTCHVEMGAIGPEDKQ